MHRNLLSFFILNHVFFLLLFTFLISCSPTKPSGKTISGKISLEDTTDFSNVKVSLFNLPQIDTSILNPLKKFNFLFGDPDLYFFDHRKQKPIAQTLTDKNGNFSFSNISDGEYILFAQKDGYGWNYIKISTTSNGNSQINMKKEIRVSGVLHGNNVWSGNYLIDGDVEIPNSSSLYISGGSIIRFNGNYKIKVNGRLETEISEAKPIVFTTDDTSIVWGGIYVSNNGVANINTSVVTSANSGVFIESSNLTLSKSVLLNNKSYGVSAIQIKQNNKVEISNCIFTGQPIGVNFEFTDTTVSVENSIFVSNSESGIYATASGVRIENNFFSGNKYSINGYSNVNSPALKIYQNNFTTSLSYHILLRGQDSEIKYNDINSTSGGISLGDMYLKQTTAVVNYNNLYGKRYLLRVGSYTSNTDARFNYWGTTSESEIRNLIFDRNDVSPFDPGYYSYGIVDYSNYFFNRINNAGIKTK